MIGGRKEEELSFVEERAELSVFGLLLQNSRALCGVCSLDITTRIWGVLASFELSSSPTS